MAIMLFPEVPPLLLLIRVKWSWRGAMILVNRLIGIIIVSNDDEVSIVIVYVRFYLEADLIACYLLALYVIEVNVSFFVYCLCYQVM